MLENGVKKVVISQVGKTKRREGMVQNVNPCTLQFRMRVPEVGISICNFSKMDKKKRVELCYIQLTEVFITYVKQDVEQSISFTLKELE